MVGMLATSKAGHDKSEIYIIYMEENEYVYLVDGRIRTVEHPKKKSKKHIQIITKFQDIEMKEKLQSKLQVRNEEIKRTIKLYQQG